MSAPAATFRSSLSKPRRLWVERRWLRPAMVWVLGCAAVTMVLGFGWWITQSPSGGTPNLAKLVIAPGTADAVATGSSSAYLPSTVSLRPGGRLLVTNEDSAEHVINDNVIPPGATAEIRAPEDGSPFSCTIHPSGTLGFSAGERPPLWLALLSGALPGVFMGLLGAGISELTRRFEPA